MYSAHKFVVHLTMLDQNSRWEPAKMNTVKKLWKERAVLKKHLQTGAERLDIFLRLKPVRSELQTFGPHTAEAES